MHVLDGIKSRNSDYLVVLVGNEDGKHPVIVAAGKSQVEKGISSGNIMKELGKLCGGNGGGKPDRAQGNILDISKISEFPIENFVK